MGKSGLLRRRSPPRSVPPVAGPVLHPAEAVHGDLGVLMAGDVVVALSASGETEEILRLLTLLKRKGDALVSFCAIPSRPWPRASDVALDCGVGARGLRAESGADGLDHAMLALATPGHRVSLRKGFRARISRTAPRGKLGKQLAKVRGPDAHGRSVPVVAPTTPMTDVIYEMSSKKLASPPCRSKPTGGLISDGDLRRLLERGGGAALAARLARR